MFVGLSKTIARFGGFRLGIGMRINKKNAVWIAFVIMFIALFKLMWYVMVFCAWIMYAIFYGMYWCLKKLFTIGGQKTKNQNDKKLKHNDNHEDEKMNNNQLESNNNLKNKQPEKKSNIARWIIGGIFAVCVLGNGLHYSTLFLSGAAFLMFPFKFMESFFRKQNIKTALVIILSVVLFLTGMFASPTTDTQDSILSDPNSVQSSQLSEQESSSVNNVVIPDVTTSGNNVPIEPDVTTSNVVKPIEPDNGTSSSTKPVEPGVTTSNVITPIEPDNGTTSNTKPITPPVTTPNVSTTAKPSSTTENNIQTTMVWIPVTGTKYHSKKSCSNMENPSQVSIEYAEQLGYEPCKRCH